METPFKVVSGDFSVDDEGQATVLFTLDKTSTESWRRLTNPLDDNGDIKKAIELLLERCREGM